jgi:hypothetical protein
MHWLDPDYLPETRGTLERFIVNPEGDMHGALLADGSVVRFPPHVGEDYAELLIEGEELWARGHVIAIEQGEALVAGPLGSDASALEELDEAPRH